METILFNKKWVFIGVLHSPLLIEISSSKFKALKTKGKMSIFEKKRLCNSKLGRKK
jgi:hypothetical protein